MIKDNREDQTGTGSNLSRRDFLKLSGGVALRVLLSYLGLDAVAAHAVSSRTFATYDFWAQLETATLGLSAEDIAALHHKVEDHFRIDIVEPEEQKSIPRYILENGVPKQLEIPILDWGGAELVVLQKSLATLPAHMYLPGVDFDHKTRFILLPYIGNPKSMGDVMHCQCAPNYADIWMARKYFATLAPYFSSTQSSIAHELAHKVSKDKGLDHEALLSQLQADRFDEVRTSFRTIDNPQKERAIKLARPASLRYGSIDVSEFTATGAQVYLRGPNTFSEVYRPFIGAEGSANFYGWLHRNIFEGTQYLTNA